MISYRLLDMKCCLAHTRVNPINTHLFAKAEGSSTAVKSIVFMTFACCLADVVNKCTCTQSERKGSCMISADFNKALEIVSTNTQSLPTLNTVARPVILHIITLSTPLCT